MRLWSLIIACLCLNNCIAQSVSDCNGAVQLCGDLYTETFATSSTGLVYEPTGACNNGLEVSSLWYTFTVVETGTMGFVLSPSNFNDDYDWGLFNITQNGCSGILNGTSPEVSCNSYGLFTNSGPTGISTANGGSGNTNGPGDLNGPAFNGDLNVIAGETYALVVMNWSNSLGGYTVDFSNSSASLYDNIAPTVLNVSSDCTAPGILVEFSENLVTSSIQAGDFILTGPNGNVTINSVSTVNPNSPGNSTITLIPAVGILPAGSYTLTFPDLAGFVNDPCGNAVTGNFDFIISPTSVSINAGPDVVICPGETTVLEATGSYTTLVWTNGPTTAQYEVGAAGNYQVTAELNGCYTSDVVSVSVQSVPNWSLGNDTTVCSVPPYSVESTVPVLWENTFTSTSYPVQSSGTVHAVYTYLGCNIVDSVFINVSAQPIIDLGNDTILCPNESLVISTPIPYSWNGLTTSDSYTVTQPQELIASFSDGVCNTSDTLLIAYIEPLNIPILDEYTYCFGDTITLSAISNGVQNVVWFDGADSPTHIFYETGVYQVTTSNSCENVSKFWNMEFVDCDNYVFVPNSFTPNGDGINDYWFPSFNNASSFEVAVFSRWGDLIFETKAEKPWVGNTNDGDYFCPDGIYAYSVKVKFNNGSAQELTGHIVLLR